MRRRVDEYRRAGLGTVGLNPSPPVKAGRKVTPFRRLKSDPLLSAATGRRPVAGAALRALLARLRASTGARRSSSGRFAPL